MGIELLEYESPNHRCSLPKDTRVNNLWFWKKTITVKSTIDRMQQRQVGRNLNSWTLKQLQFQS
jgi:hypothetical protein